MGQALAAGLVAILAIGAVVVAVHAFAGEDPEEARPPIESQAWYADVAPHLGSTSESLHRTDAAHEAAADGRIAWRVAANVTREEQANLEARLAALEAMSPPSGLEEPHAAVVEGFAILAEALAALADCQERQDEDGCAAAAFARIDVGVERVRAGLAAAP